MNMDQIAQTAARLEPAADHTDHRLRAKMTHGEAAAAIGVSPGTLRRWLREGLLPEYEGDWTPAAVGKARLIARLRDRGYTIAQLRQATQEGRLAFGRVLELLDLGIGTYTRAQAGADTGLDETVIDRVATILGINADEPLGDPDLQLLRYVATALELGLPLDAMLQLTRVYVQAISQIADAEVRLIHLYVHEPLMRSGGSADQVASELFTLTGDLLPLTSPLLEQLHRRMLSHFVDQDVVGHMEAELDDHDGDVGRMRVAIAFADLTGYTQLTEEAGDLHAADVVDRFVSAVTASLPADARVIKTIGDEVMIVGSDPVALTAWAVEFERDQRTSLRPRIAVHHGYVQYRDGDYYGREVNLAARLAARAGEGEVLVSGAVVEASSTEVRSQVRFERVAAVPLKGFAQATDIYAALPQ
jgi:adenylate cyclase